MLIDEFYLPNALKKERIYKQYDFLKNFYENGHKYILLNNTRVFAPFPKPTVCYEISDLEKMVIYDQDLSTLNKWILSRIVINLGTLDYRTIGVLTRIATGMLNKLDISRESKNILWLNMVKNIKKDHNDIMLSQLPF